MLTRALIVMLVALNLGVAAWWAWRPEPRVEASADETPSGIARLRMLHERPGAATPIRAADAKPTIASQPAATAAATTAAIETPGDATPKTERCFRFGPFADDNAVAAARRALQPKVARLREEAAPTNRNRGWRVMLPPAADRDAANAVAERLKLAGFKDFFVVADGAEANAIMLGRFGSEERATLHAASLRDAGFAARAEAVGDAKPPERWLVATTGDGFDSAAAARSSGATRAQAVDCPTPR